MDFGVCMSIESDVQVRFGLLLRESTCCFRRKQRKTLAEFCNHCSVVVSKWADSRSRLGLRPVCVISDSEEVLLNRNRPLFILPMRDRLCGTE
jgi:hypothetical protein